MTPTDMPAAPAPIPADAELTEAEYPALLREWADRFPKPPWTEVGLDYKYLHERDADGTFDQHWRDGVAVAVYHQRVIGTDTNALRLQLSKARELGVHPIRVAVLAGPRVTPDDPPPEARRCPSCGSPI